MDHRKDTAPGTSGQPPPELRETRTCPACEGEGYVPIDHRYDRRTGSLTVVGGLCSFCQGTGEQVVYLYRTKR